MRSLLFLTQLLSLLGLATAQYHHYSRNELVVSSCRASISNVTYFCKKDTAKSYNCTCNTPQGLGTMMNCLYNETVEYSTSIEQELIATCASKAHVKLTVDQIRDAYDNATSFLTDITTAENYNATHISYTPVYYNTMLFSNTYRSTYVRYRNIDFAFWMGSALLGYWGFVFLIAALYNVCNRMFFLTKYLHFHPINLLRKHLTVPALGHKRHTHPVLWFKIIGGFIPTRLESLVLFFYFVLNVCFAATGYVYVPNDTIWVTRSAQMSRYPGDRTGILCLFGFILSFLFAGRNNFLLWVTGWKQSTFLTYHKWVSRFNFLLLVAHGGAMTVQSKALGPGRYEGRLKQPWMIWGIVACVCAAVIMVTAAYRVRKTHYEVFLSSHIILVVFFLIGTWKHASDFGYDEFCYSMAAVWGFDRLVRLVRLTYFGVQKAQVTVVSDEVLKVVVPRHSKWNAFPGSFGYLHYLRPTTFLQSHPFTIVETTDKNITFYTRIKGGVTSQIHQHLIILPSKTGEIKVTVEGPYGHQRPLHRYDTVIHYTGGTGVPTSYAYIIDSIKRGLNQHIKFYWVIRNWNSLDWFYDELMRLRDHHNVQVIVFVTKPDSEPGVRHLNSSSESSDGYEETEKVSFVGISENESEKTRVVPAGMPPKNLEHVEFRYGRPHIDSLVADDIKESMGQCAVFAAAHNSMVDDIRYAVAQNLDKGKHRVEYMEELQAW